MAETQTPTDPFDTVRYWNTLRTEIGWWHSFALPDGTRIQGVCDLPGLKNRIGQFPIPEDLRGRRVLDIGTWDGWFAFEMERRGAEVLAIDNWDNPRFREMHARLESHVDYRQMDMYDLTPERIGRFDIVLFMGVLYHLKHPLLALERVCAVTTDMAAVDSFILREEHWPGVDVANRPVMEFYEAAEFGGQTDNWVAPSLACLQALCRTAGFARVELQGVIKYSACVACYRHWLPPADPARPAPKLIGAVHSRNAGINFDSRYDEEVAIWFETDGAADLTLDAVKPAVGGYGVRPIHVAPDPSHGWQANFKFPPGLSPGWHPVTVRVGDSLPSAPKSIALDMPVVPGPICIAGIRDSITWLEGEIELARGNVLSLWINGLPDNADCHNVHVYLEGRRLPVPFLGSNGGSHPWQVNVQIPYDVPRGPARIGVSIGDVRSEPADLQIR